ncbi:MAG: hypothetical protein K0S98_3082 [Propionibacteriaceae bacterium]|nr:hypothetical protein [Propionibacteriaceae bacterium]
MRHRPGGTRPLRLVIIWCFTGARLNPVHAEQRLQEIVAATSFLLADSSAPKPLPSAERDRAAFRHSCERSWR